ncbi:replicative DNA helicase [Sporolactobacillus terrae]|uniref:replicative DNA helicase n=1 Tax=Sporolactobacillus terrae TaxID=269673 RepID=UPI00048C3B15|nr:replicative DNA helicase [Sporolactobacillus terrae]
MSEDRSVIEAEQAVLGSILFDNQLMDQCWLTQDHFSIATHKAIFLGFETLNLKESPIDPVTLSRQLGDQLQQIGGIDYIAQLVNGIATTANFEFYERILNDARKLREARAKANRFVNNPSTEGIEELAKSLDEITDQQVMDDELSDRESMMNIYDSLFEKRGDISGVTTGITDLDSMTSGLQNDDLIIVAGRPSMGKTAFVLNVAKSAAAADVVVDLFSLEMPKTKIQQRLLSAIGNIDAGKWRNPERYMNAGDVESVIQSMGIYEHWTLSIHDRPAQTVASIRATIRKSLKKHPDKKHLVVIDYLSFIKITGKYERRDLAIGAVTSGLKQLARRYHLPIILVCQLSRGVEARQDKRPMLSDLRESGNIEQDADLILFLYRDDYYNRESEKQNIVEIIIGKQRNGPVGTVEAAFIKEYAKFVNLDRKAVAAYAQ